MVTRWYNTDLRSLPGPARIVVWGLKGVLGVALVYLLSCGVIVLHARYGQSSVFAYPVLGRSVEPAIEQLRPLKIGAFVIARRDVPLELQQIVIFDLARGCWCIKRVTWLSDDRRWMRVTSDNFAVTGEDSETDWGNLPTTRVKAVVTHILTVQRAFRSLTARGRADNWLRFHYRQRPLWQKGRGECVAVCDPRFGVLVYRAVPLRLLYADGDYRVKATLGSAVWRNGKLVWTTSRDWGYAAFDPATGKCERFQARATRLDELGWLDPQTVVLAGDVTGILKAGDSYKGRRVLAVKYPYFCCLFPGPTDLTHSRVTLEPRQL